MQRLKSAQALPLFCEASLNDLACVGAGRVPSICVGENPLDVFQRKVQQDVDDEAGSIAPQGGKWETWYLQGAYKFAEAKWEGVLRYTDYTSPHPDQSQEQWALGVNYLLTPNAIIKLGYEFNDGLTGETTDNDRWLVQVAYGY